MKIQKLIPALLLTTSLFILPSLRAYSSPLVPKWDKSSGDFKPLEELIFNKNGIATLGDIRIEAKRVLGPRGQQTTVYRFFFKGKPAVNLNQDAKYSSLDRVWTANLSGTGTKDFIVSARKDSDDVSSCYGIILFQMVPGVFRRLDFETFRLSAQNFMDLFHDGKCEVVLRSIYGLQRVDKRSRGFLVYTAYRIEDYSLRRMEFGKGGFPRYTRFSQSRLPKPAASLSDRQKQGIYDSRPNSIKSEYLQ